MESVYLETTFISYLVARPSRDLLVAAHQQVTQEWWANRLSVFECSVSQVVIDEASLGDPTEIQKRLAIIVDRTLQGQGLGGQLLLSAGRRCLLAATEVGGVALLIDAKNERAANWYAPYGAVHLADAPRSLILPLAKLQAALELAGKLCGSTRFVRKTAQSKQRQLRAVRKCFRKRAASPFPSVRAWPPPVCPRRSPRSRRGSLRESVLP